MKYNERGLQRGIDVNKTQEKSILIISNSDLARDPRVYRQIESLAGDYIIHSAGKKPSGLEEKFYQLHRTRLDIAWIQMVQRSIIEGFFFHKVAVTLVIQIRKILPIPFDFIEMVLNGSPLYRKFINDASAQHYDLVIINDFSGLSLGMKFRGRAGLIYDAHEYSYDQSNDRKWQKHIKPYVGHLLRKYLHGADAMLTVCDGIADEYMSVFGVKRPTVITNAPKYKDMKPSVLIKSKVRLVHHGVAARQRAIEQMIEVVDRLDDQFTLDMFLVHNNEDYYHELQRLSARSGRVRILDPIPMTHLVERLNAYDVGIYILPPVNFNHLHALPNKLFEFVQARLAVAIGPSPEMATYVRKYDLGVVAEDFTAEAMAKALSSLSKQDIARFKGNAHKHAYELSAEPQMEKLRTIVRSIIGD